MAAEKSVRVLIDAHLLGLRETGNETYIANLLQHVGTVPGLQCGAAIVDPGLDARPFAPVELLPLPHRGNWSRLLLGLPSLCRRWRADILHVTYVGPFISPCPLVVTAHDVSFRRYPEFFSPRNRLLFGTLLPLSLRRASAVITLSQHAKQEMLELFPYLQGRVHVTPLAPSPLFRPIRDLEPLQSICSRYGIGSQFILAVGNLQPRKNLLRLMAAYASLRASGQAVQLVIVGQAQWQSSTVYAAVERFGLEKDVVFTGYVPDEDLVLLYNAARIFIYPSVYEGFGLPILEAMACGVPSIASSSSAMPEVAGDAALLVDPHQEEAMAQAMLRLLTDADLAEHLAAKGMAWVTQFSWRRTATETAAIYRAVQNGQAGARR